jgi:topoisomerase-4 subunit B
MQTVCEPGACLEAMRDFCGPRKLSSPGVKLAPDDVWDRCCYVLSSKLGTLPPGGSDPFKEIVRVRQRRCLRWEDAFSLWLNQHTEEAEKARGVVH